MGVEWSACGHMIRWFYAFAYVTIRSADILTAVISVVFPEYALRYIPTFPSWRVGYRCLGIPTWSEERDVTPLSRL